MDKKIIGLMVVLSIYAHADVSKKYNEWQTRQTENNIGKLEREQELQKVKNELLYEKLDGLYAVQDYENSIKDRELYRKLFSEYFKNEVYRNNYYRYDNYEDYWAWHNKRWW